MKVHSTRGLHGEGFAPDEMYIPLLVSAFLQRRYVRVKGGKPVERWYFTQPVDHSKNLFIQKKSDLNHPHHQTLYLKQMINKPRENTPASSVLPTNLISRFLD